MGVQAIEKKPRLSPKKKRRTKAWLLVTALIVVVAIAAIGGSGFYRRFHEARLIKRGRQLLTLSDFNDAELNAQRVLQLSPNNVDANRLMADIADAAGSRNCLYWRRTTAELQPDSPHAYLKWADSALRFNEPAMAELALSGIKQNQRQSAAYYNMAGRVADGLKQPDKAEAAYSHAANLEPQNQQYELDLARIHLLNGEPAAKQQARLELARLAKISELFSPASHALIEDALGRKSIGDAIGLAQQLQKSPGASFDDHILCLTLLKVSNHPDFSAYLTGLQTQNSTNPDRLAALVEWMNQNGLALLATDWWKRLPASLRARNPLPAAITESFVMTEDWQAVKNCASNGNWGRLEFLRMAFLARAAREEGDDLGSRNQWNSAVSLASGTPEALSFLARSALTWGWDDRAEDLLWQVAQGSYDQQWALQALYRRYYSTRSTGNLLKVVARNYELDPADPSVQNNLAALDLLLQVNVPQAEKLADALYNSDPNNPDYASTYAFGLHLLGKSKEGVQVMQRIAPEQLSEPSKAAYYGALLVAAGGPPDEARKYLDLADSGYLFREEYTLVNQARDQLRGKGPADAGATNP